MAVLALIMSFAAPPAAAAPGARVSFGDTTIEEGETVSGRLVVIRGDLVVRGTVEGNVYQLGRGFVHIDGGHVFGDVYEWGRGTLQVFGGGVVEGDVVERGNNGTDAIGVDVARGGVVRGNVYEYGSGNVDVAHDHQESARVEGSIFERGVGKVSVYNDCEVWGDVEERGRGDVIIEERAIVGGEIREFGPGEVFDARIS